jgi:DNA-binding beta-propeller fold protein YncE
MVVTMMGASVLLAQEGRGRGRGQQAGGAEPAGRGNQGQGAAAQVNPPDAPPLPYHFVPAPEVPAGQRYGNVAALALTPQNHLIVFNRNPDFMMVEYDAQGQFVRSFNPNMAANAHGLRVDRFGNIWAIDSYQGVVYKMDSHASVLKVLGTRGENGPWDDAKWNGMFNQPLDLAFDKDDNFYVVQSHGGTSGGSAGKAPAGSDPRVLKFDKNGQYVTSRSLAHADGSLPTIHGVMYTQKGELWVTDRQLNKILVMDTTLKPIREIQMAYLTSGLFQDAKGGIWMSAGMNSMVMSLDENGKITGWAGKGGQPTPEDPYLMGEAHYVTVSADQKTIYVADSTRAQVIKLEKN